MNVPVTFIARKYRIFLPYWAVLQTDLHQTTRNWVYLTWVFGTMIAAFGFLLFRMGIHKVAGMVQYASVAMSDMLHWIVLGSLALIAVQTVGAISSERGTLADSVLSRGISRYQYFLAKWHARLAAVLGTFGFLASLMLIASYFLLHENLSLAGGIAALLLIAAFFMVVVSFGVALSSLCNSTLLGMSVLWMLLYGGGILLELLPKSLPTPDRVLQQMPEILQGRYDSNAVLNLLAVSAGASCLAAFAGLISFSRRDV